MSFATFNGGSFVVLKNVDIMSNTQACSGEMFIQHASKIALVQAKTCLLGKQN